MSKRRITGLSKSERRLKRLKTTKESHEILYFFSPYPCIGDEKANTLELVALGNVLSTSKPKDIKDSEMKAFFNDFIGYQSPKVLADRLTLVAGDLGDRKTEDEKVTFRDLFWNQLKEEKEKIGYCYFFRDLCFYILENKETLYRSPDECKKVLAKVRNEECYVYDLESFADDKAYGDMVDLIKIVLDIPEVPEDIVKLITPSSDNDDFLYTFIPPVDPLTDEMKFRMTCFKKMAIAYMDWLLSTLHWSYLLQHVGFIGQHEWLWPTFVKHGVPEGVFIEEFTTIDNENKYTSKYYSKTRFNVTYKKSYGVFMKFYLGTKKILLETCLFPKCLIEIILSCINALDFCE